MNFAFICPTMPYLMPYLESYFDIMQANGYTYDIICWNRRGQILHESDPHIIVYDHPTRDDYSAPRKLYDILRFARFAESHLKSNTYDGVFSFTIAESIFLQRFLSRRFPQRFFFDIRDYSPFIKLPLFRRIVSHLLRDSALNIISSAGFNAWLPQGFAYTLCHNITLEQLQGTSPSIPLEKNDHLRILTIGRIRDPQANISVVRHLGNAEGITVDFIGDARDDDVKIISNYVKQQHITNVFFHGHYEKSEEGLIAERYDMFNVCMEDDLTSRHLMSNRIYLAALHSRPLLSYDNCYQADIIKCYGIGLVVARNSDMLSQLQEYWQHFDVHSFQEGCQKFLRDIKTEQTTFVNAVGTCLHSFEQHR